MNLLVIGLGVTGSALCRFGSSQGWDVTVVEDSPGREGYERLRSEAEALGARVVEAPDAAALEALVAAAELIVPSPGVPVSHPVYDAAQRGGTRLVSEIELASQATTVPVVAVTGTNGKTTVTTLVSEMLTASGRGACVAGNIGRPLIEVVQGDQPDVIVAEVSSFQLRFTESFHPAVAVILNVADDHLDWHPTFEHYRDAKARIFANQDGDDVLVLNADDPVCAAMGDAPMGEGEGERTRARIEWFSTTGLPGCFGIENGVLLTSAGEVIADVSELHEARPHDIGNALAASAAALAAGATLHGVVAALRAHEGLPHRLTLVGEAGGVRWYDDSKATNPHATLAALSGFDSVVLMAGGRNKGLDLSVLASAADRIRHVVAFGESAPELEAVFAGRCPAERVASMGEAVAAAARVAVPGDSVVLSPACASFDAYSDYAARGRDFTAEVQGLLDTEGGDQ
ncbi:MAG: UDP-N-acetylmuramoyl-L-alanine--D-glutamate ligase [Actinobacteria bacterium]|nr:UDP-N-acetylmuramoyl-L-alanine--D-glutamate ligase [Actinomycetota bacterium]